MNGRFAGASTGGETCLPASPTGAVYIEFKPTRPGFLPLARSVCLSGGNIVEASVSPQRGLSAVQWPGGVAEIALEPEPLDGYREGSEAAGVNLDGSTRQVVTPLDDVAGHALVETYKMENGSWLKADGEIMWDESCPKWPKTPEDTAIAAVQAALLGQYGEMAGYVASHSPQVVSTLKALNGVYDGCARATYRPISDAVALVKVVAENLARVDYAKYSCARQAGSQGEWKVEGFGG